MKAVPARIEWHNLQLVPSGFNRCASFISSQGLDEVGCNHAYPRRVHGTKPLPYVLPNTLDSRIYRGEWTKGPQATLRVNDDKRHGLAPRLEVDGSEYSITPLYINVNSKYENIIKPSKIRLL